MDCKGKYFFSIFQVFPYYICNISLFFFYNNLALLPNNPPLLRNKRALLKKVP